MEICPNNPPLEDELGDVIEKAMHRAGLNDETLAALSGVSAGKILDAIDYRSDLSCEEIRRLATSLELNEVGLCALGTGKYPRPALGTLPFCVWPLQMPYGIGMANAYLVAECGSHRAVLFDTGPGSGAVQSIWPNCIRQLDAVFLTHIETEHVGGLAEVTNQFRTSPIYVPEGANVPAANPMGEGAERSFGALTITAFATPGHAAAHNCYVVRATSTTSGGMLLISGDLIFAGSAGGGYFSPTQLTKSLRRVLSAVPPKTILAPGHGPMSTVANERRYNPFLV